MLERATFIQYLSKLDTGIRTVANGISITSYKKRGGNVTYNLRVRRKGTLVTDHFTTKRAAERAGIKIVAAIDDGTYEKKDSDLLAKMTFAEGIDRYLEDEMVKAKKGYEQDRYKAAYMKSAKFAKKPLIKIKTSDLAEYRDSRINTVNTRTGKGLAPQTIRNDFTIIKGVFGLAISEWGFDTLINPSIGIRLPKPSKGRVKRLNEGEEEAILKLAREDTERVWLAPFIEFAIHTGMRLSEICRIESKHVNLQSQL